MGSPDPTNLPPKTASGMPLISKKFIGAVEDHWELYSDSPDDYTIGPAIGFGASSIVYSALYQPPTRPPPPIPCALKVLDLDSLPPHSLALLQRETTLMSLSKHPNVLRVRGSWMAGHKLYIALRLMNKGSVADVMQYGWPGGLEEGVIRCILRQALQGLNYLHINGFIHRDVKAANLLIDDDGTVLLGDLGVAADLSEESSTSKTQKVSVTAVSQPIYQRTSTSASQSNSGNNGHVITSKHVVLVDSAVQRPKVGKRKSFVGTPCWMAPELILGKQYDSSADIWSFGITALELTQGRPPRARETPQRVLIRTVQEAPPTLDRDGGTFKYSHLFQEMVESCLVKDPSKRPTAEQLLQTSFFKNAKKPSYLVDAILKELPPLAQRQERRVLPSASTRASIESWDFATTVHSPSMRRIRDTSLDADIFEMDVEGDDDSVPSHNHSRAISWSDRLSNQSQEQRSSRSQDVDTAPSSTSESPTDSESSRLSGTSPALSTPSSATSDMLVVTKNHAKPIATNSPALRTSGTSFPAERQATATTRLWSKLKSAASNKK